MDAGIEASRALIESILSRKIDTSDKLLKALHKSKTGESTSDEDEENEPHAWISNDAGWTALHAAAYIGDRDLVEALLRHSDAVWSLPDGIGMTAGDIAYSMGHHDAYEALVAEGVRAEMIRAILPTEEEDEEMEGDEAPKRSTTSDNSLFLSTPLTFTTDPATGQEICVDIEGIGVMMHWEGDLMRATSRELARDLQVDEDEESAPAVLNVGFGLGLIDTYLAQDVRPRTHVIIEPHPDVLRHARSKGWYDREGVRFYEGTWQQYFAAVDNGEEPWQAFDVIYYDTYSEHYKDLHAFFDRLPDILRGPGARFSFFHGLGATSQTLYDIYTEVSEMHLRDAGLATTWHEVDVAQRFRGESTWQETARKYWDVPGPFRVPICELE